MNAITRFTHYVHRKPEYLMDMVRMFLGVVLVLKGVSFSQDPNLLAGMIEGTALMEFWPVALAHYIILAHIVGGLFLCIGLLTRLAALAQVPILMGAVFMVHLPQVMAGQVSHGLEYATLTLFLLSMYSLFGSCHLSVDEKIFGDEIKEDLRMMAEEKQFKM